MSSGRLCKERADSGADGSPNGSAGIGGPDDGPDDCTFHTGTDARPDGFARPTGDGRRPGEEERLSEGVLFRG